MIAGIKSYPEMKPSDIERLGDVPAHWKTLRLRNLASVLFSNVDKHSKDDENPVWLCNYSDVYHNDCIHPDMDFMEATATEKEIEQFHLVADDVLITKDSETWNDIGVPALVKSTNHDLICGYHLALLRPVPDRIIGEYLYLALLCQGVASQLFVHANGVTRFGLSQNAIKSVWLPVPSLPEQTTISRFLGHTTSRIERYIRTKQKLIRLLEEQKQAIIHQAVTGQIDVRTGQPYPAYKPSGVEWLEGIPAHWDARPAKWHFREVDERSDTGSEELLSVSHLTGVTPRSQKNVTMFKAESNVGHKVCNSGDIVINTMWAWMAALGVAQQIGLVSPSYAVYRQASNSLLSRDYAELLLKSAPYRAEYRRLSTGIRPSRLRLYPDMFLRIKLICPLPEEQTEIVAFVQRETANIDQASRLMSEEIAKLKEYHARLIADVVTGKLDVREAAARLSKTDPITHGEEVDSILSEQHSRTDLYNHEQKASP